VSGLSSSLLINTQQSPQQLGIIYTVSPLLREYLIQKVIHIYFFLPYNCLRLCLCLRLAVMSCSDIEELEFLNLRCDHVIVQGRDQTCPQLPFCMSWNRQPPCLSIQPVYMEHITMSFLIFWTWILFFCNVPDFINIFWLHYCLFVNQCTKGIHQDRNRISSFTWDSHANLYKGVWWGTLMPTCTLVGFTKFIFLLLFLTLSNFTCDLLKIIKC